MTREEVFQWMHNSLERKDKDALCVIYWLMIEDILPIAELVKMKEDSLHERYDELKENASEMCAVAVCYKEKFYDNKDKKGNIVGQTKESLDKRYVKIMNKLGFIKPITN